MSTCFNQYVIGMNVGTVSQVIAYFWFAEEAFATPMPMKTVSEARFLESEATAKNYISTFETMNRSLKGRLFIIPIKCQAMLPGSTFVNPSSQKTRN
jgi:hypothetical protein